MKKVLSIICVLALVVSLCSVFSFAAAPEVDAGDGARANARYVVSKTGTYVYNSASASSGYKYNFPIPVGTQVVKESSGSTNGFIYATCYYNGTCTGYVKLSNLTEVQ